MANSLFQLKSKDRPYLIQALESELIPVCGQKPAAETVINSAEAVITYHQTCGYLPRGTCM